ncbi:SRPBCC family protein [Natrinema salaciae]|uniref:Ligand-binding SRPBCC domain-containing protein n=1 Tax=Natrinema salaciae TaxID=1186196 RepID=A0A1H9F6J6_9EURY|nr:SRPBCC family protein [Natrinema salaciae]SEQ33552.1 Ligand-binding SRPBCC domain-containing protein [Natrinema salaciae]
MPTFQRSTVIDAAFETVWEFFDTVDELELLTPDWMGLCIPRAIGPDGERDPDGYFVGTEIHLETRPFDLFTATEWVVEIVERDVSEERASFVDEQVGDRGPFETWRHDHRFVDLGRETLLYDRVDYRVPGPGEVPLATPFLAAMLWYRHRRTRALLAE